MQNKKLIAFVLTIAAVCSLIYGILTPSKVRRELSASSETIQQDKPTKTVRRIIFAKRHAKRTAFLSWGRDPFWSKSAPTPKPTMKHTLSGVIWKRNNPMAILDGSILVGIGDRVGEYIMVDIKPKSVTLSDGVNDFELFLSP